MAKITWLGDGSADENVWNGLTFRQGEAVNVTDEAMIETAKNNRFFKVAGEKAKADEGAPAGEPLMGRPDDIPENAAFASQEQLDARHDASVDAQRQDEDKRATGRKKS